MVLFSLLLCAAMAFEDAGSAEYFKITVVDEQTGRGVPLVELRTVNDVRYVTDSAGVVAFHEPGLMGTDVFFEVTSHGYEYPRDGFGFRGTRLKAVPGESAVVRISRKNIAERLYRVTGGGIYRDSLLVGDTPPIRQPVLNAQVFGSDSVVNAVYRGRVYWFWGDTNRPSYPLGNFHVPGATSRLPADGGLDPEVGIDLDYFADEAGFARPTAKLPGAGPTWINGLVVVRDASGVERMFARYVKVKPPMTVYESGLVEFDDETKSFVHRVRFPDDAPVMPHGHPLRVVEDGVEYVHFGDPYPDIRVRASAEAVQDLSRYEAYTPLKAGTREKDAEVDRFPDGRVCLAWKRNTPPVTTPLLERLVREQKLREGEWPFQLRDAVSGKRVVSHRGSVCWNEYRKRYVMITTESHGTSLLGETWYAESDRPVGPWVYACKIVTHEKYSFYNPKQHPMFDKAGGRIIFFEGTYTDTFSGNPDRTPRYNYNQVFYKLDLADERLALPVAVRDRGDKSSESPSARFHTTADGADGDRPTEVVWYALDRPTRTSIAVYARDGSDGLPELTLEHGPPAVLAAPAFYAIAPDHPDPPAGTTPLYEYSSKDGKRRAYSTLDSPPWGDPAETRRVICRVWPIPSARPGS